MGMARNSGGLEGRILVRDKDFSPIYISYLEEGNLDLRDGRYLRLSQIAALTGQCKPATYDKLKSNKVKKIRYSNQAWYLINDNNIHHIGPKAGQTGKVIKNYNFEDLWVDPFEVDNLPLNEGCYLRLTHLGELTGLTKQTIWKKVRKHGLETRKESYNKIWHRVDLNSYSRLERNKM
jgi:predicted DNA-binding transcriptional regulator AlpA